MLSTIAFLGGIALSLTISLMIVYLMQPVLQRLLAELCGTTQRASFWSRFSQIMLVISPLLTATLLFTAEPVDTVLLLRETLFNILLGIFVALVVIALLIWKSIPLSVGLPENSGENSP